MNERNKQIEAIYHFALDQATEEGRSAYMDSACRGDAELRASVEGLLEAHDKAGTFLETPVFGLQPDLTEAFLAVPLSEGTGSVIGRYKLLQHLGEGGFGNVYMAQQTQPVKRRVALKIIKLGMDTKQVVARFEAERQALALMDHPNVA